MEINKNICYDWKIGLDKAAAKWYYISVSRSETV